MGGHPYFYVVEYQADIQAALDGLREREFKAGRYNPVVPNLEFPLTAASPAPGAKHASIELAREAAGEEGTRSILDIETIDDAPDFFVAAPLADDVLDSFYGTKQPTREKIGEDMDFMEEVERGNCVYIILHKDGKPHEILFAGYSLD